MANFWGGCTPPRHSGTWVGARVASLRCHYPPPRRSHYSRNAEDRPHQSKTSCRGGHRRGTTTSGPGRGSLAGFAVTFYGRFSGDRRGIDVSLNLSLQFHEHVKHTAFRARCYPVKIIQKNPSFPTAFPFFAADVLSQLTHVCN